MTSTRMSFLLLTAATVALPLLGGCNPASPPASTTPPATQTATASTQPQTALGKMVNNGIQQARAEIEHGNVDIDGHISIHTGDEHGSHDHKPDSHLPKAQITPQGDLLIEDKAVAVTPEQRALLLGYRRQLIGVIDAGMAIGVQGADLAGKAVSEAIGSIFSGNGADLDKRMEVEGKKIEAEAMKLCTQLPPMLAMQQKLAASLPAFKPYATMDQADIDDCGKDAKHKGISVTSN